MRALSLSQPWAWLVIHGGKDIENRVWEPKLRGEFLIHAAASNRLIDHRDATAFVHRVFGEEAARRIPSREQLQRGGIVGAAELFDVLPRPMLCRLPDGWRMAGQYGLRLRNVRPLPFLPCKGLQRWWGNFEIRDGKAVQVTP